MSTRSRAAMSSAFRSGRTLNAMMIAFERRRQQHVRLVHRADARVDDADLHLLVGQLGERVGQHLGRALHVGLDDDRQLLHAAFGDLRLQRLEREPAALRAERAALGLLLAERRDLPRLGRVGQRLEHVARLRQAGQAEHFDRRGRPGRLDRTAAVVDQRAHAADDRAGDERVADVERAVLHEHRRHRARGPCRAWLRAPCPTRCASGWP